MGNQGWISIPHWCAMNLHTCVAFLLVWHEKDDSRQVFPLKCGWKIWWKKLFVTMSKPGPLIIKIRNHALICHGGKKFKDILYNFPSKRKVGLVIILPNLYCLLLSTELFSKDYIGQILDRQRFHKSNQNIAQDASLSMRTDLNKSKNFQIHLTFGGVDVTMNSW